MGEYLYGLRKLPKRKLVNTDNGPAVVEYVLEFKCKPHYTGICRVMDKNSYAIVKRLIKRGPVQATVQYGNNVYKWNGSAYWFDGDNLKNKAELIGTIRD